MYLLQQMKQNWNDVVHAMIKKNKKIFKDIITDKYRKQWLKEKSCPCLNRKKITD